ncbi:MAG: hypothetical protein EZS28_017838 [Streblomastix strix]|uniref:Uncharacterized protein n=1 Tax=Streblomastix strix TaxID=222440 RepID=A0A5J4VVD2_9EUKA|nr:MAG: hypothetical protein EZS28_017838 [Streblomastix strix]
MFRGGQTTAISPNIHEKERDGAPNSQELDPPRSGGYEEDQAVPPWMRVLLGRPPDSPEAVTLQEQLYAATKMYEVYYAKKAENLDPASERATKHERELLLKRENETLGLELNKKGVTPGSGGADPEDEIETARMAVLIQRACVAGSTALIQGDFQATQRFFLTCHHAARIIAGDFQQRRETAIISEQYKAVLGKNNNIFAVLGRESKEKNQRIGQDFQNNNSNKRNNTSSTDYTGIIVIIC